jgi:predicted metal-dependent hydrolase
VDFDSSIPRYWFGGNAVGTHIANGVNLLFPAGERFFVRSVRYYMDHITDPVLREQIRGFFGQEGSHAREHERQFRLLEEQGFDLTTFFKFYNWLAYEVLEKASPPELRLAGTAACEHFTALMAENALRIRLLDHAHPSMRALLLWHSAEEIEHRAVAFDVLQQVNPSYALRVAGLALATVTLSGFWALGAATLIQQDKQLGWKRAVSEWRSIRANRKQEAVFVRGIREYLKRDFHPSQNRIDELAAEYIESVGLPGMGLAAVGNA